MPFTTMDNLYDELCLVVEQVTERPAWSKSGIQATPNQPYATVLISEDDSQTHDIVQLTSVDSPGVGEASLREVVWGACKLSVEIEFYKDSTSRTAAEAATMMKNGLHRTAREDDLWQICALVGPIKIVNMSSIFRQDTENRHRLLFGLYANIIDPNTLTGDTDIFEIDSQEIDIYRVDASTDDNLVTKKTISRL